MGRSSLSATADDYKRASKKPVPTIYYASRTHSQISQVIREYRKTSYRVPMAILASKKRYCINDHVCNKQNVDEECKLLLKDRNRGCVGSKNAHKLKSHPSVRKGGSLEVHDIEDLVKVGRDIQGCPYFGAQLMAIDAHIIFCPYSYVLDPVVRRAMDVDLTGAIVIFDEAHNIEDMARDAGSFDAEEVVLDKLQVELAQLSSVDNNIYQPLHDMIQGITTWMGHRKDKLEKFEFERHFSCWTGDNAIKELEAAGISQQCFPVLQQCAMKAIKIASDAEIDRVHLSGMSVATLDGLISALSSLLAGGGIHLIDYQLALQRYIKRESGSNASGWTHCFSLWCLNPSVIFRELADLSLSVILTSGTLSPMSSFASELGVQFEICMEAPHVINMESQLWAAVVSNGPDNVCLNASYKTADNYAFQDSLGASLEEICKVVPGGVLVFFPSYKLMDKLCCRWKQTGLWYRLCERKPVFVEPRGSDDFESVLRGYYGSIRGMRKPVKLKGRNKRDFKHLVIDDSPQNDPKGEAALLAVCRGKVSEGIDFSDENARVVVIVGIPFPNKSDIKVVMKRRYNDKYRSSKRLLSGNEWYCQQAFRALNQASGRCIRHRGDYGAIILLDERFKGENNVANMSKWLRKSIKEYDNFSMAIKALEKFYPEAKEKVDEKYVNMKTAAIGDSFANEGHEKTTNNSGSGSQKKKTQKVKKICKGQEKQIASSDKLMPLGSCVLKKLPAAIKENNLFYSPSRMEECNSPLVDSSRVKAKTIDGQKRDEIMGTSLRKASRSTVEDSGNSTGSDSKLSSDTEGEHVYDALVEQEDNFPATAPTPSESPDNLSHHSYGFMTPSGVSSKDALLPTVTPESTVGAEDIINPEFESSLSHSVNSYHQKMRKPISLQLHRYMQMNAIGSIGDESVECTDSMSMHSSSQAKWRTGLAYQDGTSGIMSESFRESHPKVPDMESLMAQPASCNFGELSERGEDCIRSMMSCLCCSVCDNPLGLAEDHFLVNCSFSSSSKYCLRSLMKTALVTGDSEESLVGSDPGLVPIIISDVNSIDCRVSRKRATVSAPNEDIWSEEDGCVFRPVYCPYCSMSNPCLGLQVMATDTSNIHLLEKILFLENRVTARIHDAMSKEVSTLADGSVSVAASDPSLFQKNSCLVGSTSVGCVMARHSKLRLPRKQSGS